MGELNLGAVMAQDIMPAEGRSIETITGEILELKKTAGESILGIGQRLLEVKAMLPHGEWSAWLAEQVEFSERAAQRFMRLAREWSNPTTLSVLGASKALTLLALPPEEREQFMAETHEVDGEEKAVIDMSARQLEQAIREREEALADKKAAEDARAKMAEDMNLLKALLESAQEDKARADAAVSDLEREIAEIKAAPVDVAVMTVDQEALDKARAEAIAEMQAKLDKAQEDKKRAVEKRKAAEENLASVQAQLEAALKAEKKAAFAADKDVATFEVLFNQAQDIANRLQGLLIKARGRDDQALADKLRSAMQALAGAIGRAAE